MKKRVFGIAAIIAVIAFIGFGCGGDSGGSGDDSKIKMVKIPGGTFWMGSPASEPDRGMDETQHSVTVSGFSMSKYPITQAQYEEVIGENPSYCKTTNDGKSGADLPVEMVTWYDAVEFCNKLSEKEGLDQVYTISGRTPGTGYPITGATEVTVDWTKNGYRLPTEAEWEYACRGNYKNKDTEENTKPFGIGDGTKMMSGMANFNTYYEYDAALDGEIGTNTSGKGYVGQTTPVGKYKANSYGLYDMHGNVLEWCWDWYDDYPGDVTDYRGPASGSYRVDRGGSWDNVGQDLRSALRTSDAPDIRDFFIGFRVVRQ